MEINNNGVKDNNKKYTEENKTLNCDNKNI